MARLVLFLGWVVLLAGIGLVVVALVGIALRDGIWAALWMLSPFNVINFIVTALTLAPGLAIIAVGQRLAQRD